MQSTSLKDQISGLYRAKNSLRKDINKWRRQQKVLDIVASMLGVLGLVVAIIESELYERQMLGHIYYNSNRTRIVEIHDFDEEPRIYYLRGFVTITSVMSGAIVLARRLIERKIYREYANLRGLTKPDERSMNVNMVMMVIYVLIHTPPGLNVTVVYNDFFLYFTLDTLITCIMTLRVFFLILLYVRYCKWGNEFAEEVCFSQNSHKSNRFVLKCVWKEYPISFVTLLIIVSMGWGGYLIQICERPYQYISGQNWDFIWNGSWASVLTITTVGYGDYYASTLLGRIVTVIVAIWGNFITSLMVLTLSKILDLNKRQSNAVRKFYKKTQNRQIITLAQKTIYHFMKYCFHFRSLKVYWRRKSYGLHYNLTKTCMEFAKMRKKANSSIDTIERIIEHHAELVEKKINKSWMAVKMAKYDVQILLHQIGLNETKQYKIDQLSRILYDANSRLQSVTLSYEKLHGYRKDGFAIHAFNILSAYPSFYEEAKKIIELDDKHLNMSKIQIQNAFRFHDKLDDIIVNAEEKTDSEEPSPKKVQIKRSIHRLSSTLNNLYTMIRLKNADDRSESGDRMSFCQASRISIREGGSLDSLQKPRARTSFIPITKSAFNRNSTKHVTNQIDEFEKETQRKVSSFRTLLDGTHNADSPSASSMRRLNLGSSDDDVSNRRQDHASRKKSFASRKSSSHSSGDHTGHLKATNASADNAEEHIPLEPRKDNNEHNLSLKNVG